MVYDFYAVAENRSLRRSAAVDRFLINIKLGPSPANLSRQTYTGVYNISLLDLSFSVRCTENFYGPDCNIFCVPVQGLYSCDKIGQKLCQNESCDPITECQMCKSSVPMPSQFTTPIPVGRNSEKGK